MTALQNELRSGLRELDTVKGELAIAASSRGMMGRRLGSTVGRGAVVAEAEAEAAGSTALSGGSAVNSNMSFWNADVSSTLPKHTQLALEGNTSLDMSGRDYLDVARSQGEDHPLHQSSSQPQPQPLAPRSQSVAAVAEEEWVKQGIGFKSRIESTASGKEYGSDILSNLIQQSLIHDQYDRAVQEGDDELHQRMERIKKSREGKKGKENDQ